MKDEKCPCCGRRPEFEIAGMNSLQKRAIAKMVYKEIDDIIEKWSHKDLPILFHWDGCITVDDELFHEHQLRDDE